MRLRPRQKTFVDLSCKALKKHRNTLAVAPTGAGKTVMFSSVAGQMINDTQGKALILAHRDELTAQNQEKFSRVNPGISTSIFDSRIKDWSGQATFAMVQTLCREGNVEAMPPIDLLVIDEAHHAVANSYLRIIGQARRNNPKTMIYGVTATPNRGDKKGLRPVFNNLADQIQISELIASGHLVRPRTFIIDVGVQDDLKKVRRIASDFDMGAVAEIMDKSPITDAVIRHWQEKAKDRKTVVFCSTVAHAQSVTDSFIAHGVKAVMVHGNMTETERKDALASYEQGDAQVVVNVAVLTEGWDFQPTSCVILLRPSSYKSTMVQMIGRGLRVVDPEVHPDVIKEDCIVLDFGTSSLTHGCLEVDVDLDGKQAMRDAEAPTKECPECMAEVPIAVMECPFCEHKFESEAEEKEELSNFIMSEIDLLQRSNFRWCDLYGDDSSLLACGFNAFAGLFFLNGHWYSVGYTDHNNRLRLLAQGERTNCLAAADDFLNNYETDESAHKSKRWLDEAPTEKQLALLPGEYRMDLGLNKYHASSLLKFQFNKNAIRNLLFEADKRMRQREAV